jgi:hypothetical protein
MDLIFRSVLNYNALLFAESSNTYHLPKGALGHALTTQMTAEQPAVGNKIDTQPLDVPEEHIFVPTFHFQCK